MNPNVANCFRRLTLSTFYFENSSNWFWSTDADFRFVFSNGKLEKWLDLPADFLIGKTFIELEQQAPHLFSFLTEISGTLANDPNCTHLSVELKTTNQVEPFAQLKITLEKGRSVAGDVEYNGVAEKERIGSTASESNGQFEMLHVAVENSPNGILITNLDGIIEYVNPGFCEMSGYTKGECIGNTPRLYQSGNTSEMIYSSLWGTLNAQKTWKGTVQNKRKNGELFWCEETISPVEDSNGVVSHYIAIQQDVTDRVKAEEDLLKSEERFKGFTDAASDWYWEMDKEFNFSFFSESTPLFTGRSVEEMIGQKRNDLMTLKEDKEKWKVHQQDLADGKPFKEYSYTYFHPDGRKMNFVVSGKPIYCKDGKFQGYLGIGRDNTKQKLLEEKLRQSQKMDAIGQIASGVAHDFNNFLSVISGNAELLSERLEKDGVNIGKELKNIAFAADKGAELSRQILSVCRIEDLAPVRVNINNLIQEIKGMIVSSLSGRVELEINECPDVWFSHVDSQQITNAILNACINARDAMNGKGKIVIETANIAKRNSHTVKNLTPGDYVLLSIQDNGKGIEKENLERIFEPFFTTKPAGEGTGLGLSMLAEFAEQSGGSVVVDSEIDVGTTLSLYLPRLSEC